MNTAVSSRLLRDTLARADYTEQALCNRLGLGALDGVDLPSFKSLVRRTSETDPQGVLARLLLFGHAVSEARVDAVLSPLEVEALTAVDLLRRGQPGESLHGKYYASTRLVPVACEPTGHEILVAGDRTETPDGSSFVAPPDIVFSGHNPLTRQFLRLLPRTPTGTVLDLCAGTGVAAIASAPHAYSCVAADIAQRSAHFARFNAWLNDVPNLSVACGDLYEPVSGQRFDRIVAHPPYVPAVTHEFTYRDGGETGEAIVRGIVSGVETYLNPGGIFQIMCVGMDTDEGPFERRVRGWLGDAGSEFDIIFALDSRTQPENVAAQLVARGGAAVNPDHWRSLFQRLHVREFVYGAVVGRRRVSVVGEPITRRVVLTDDTTPISFDWLLSYFDASREPGFGERLLSQPVRLNPALTLEVRHRVEAGGFKPEGYTLSNGGLPFLARLEMEPWVVALLNDMQGKQSAIELLRDARARGRAPDGFDETQLISLMAYLLERGCVQLGGTETSASPPASP